MSSAMYERMRANPKFQELVATRERFAWTLSIGVITSVFTAVLVTQVLLVVWLRLRRPKKLPVAW